MGASFPLLPERVPTPGTQGHGESPPRFRLRGYHPLRPRTSTGVRLPVVGSAPGPHYTTSPEGYPSGVRFGLCRFRSPLLTASRLLSFPPGTKMFQFPGFPRVIPAIRRSPVLGLHAPRRGLSQLATAFLGSRAEPSTSRVTCTLGPLDLLWAASSPCQPLPPGMNILRCISNCIVDG